MRRHCRSNFVAAVVLMAWLFSGAAGAVEKPEAAKKEAAYIGVDACGKCHKRESKGDQLGHWRASKHAQAYETLATPEAKKIATEHGVDDPQQDGRCLKCHATAYGVDLARIAPPAKGKHALRVEDGVQCETCHGPGSLYKKRKIMKDKDASIAAGLIIPDEKTCVKCHNEDSPNFTGFDYDEMWKKIAHLIPEKAEKTEK